MLAGWSPISNRQKARQPDAHEITGDLQAVDANEILFRPTRKEL